MPRPKTEALVELSSWMEQAHQLQSALNVLTTRVAPVAPKPKRRKTARSKKSAPAAKSGH